MNINRKMMKFSTKKKNKVMKIVMKWFRKKFLNRLQKEKEEVNSQQVNKEGLKLDKIKNMGVNESFILYLIYKNFS